MFFDTNYILWVFLPALILSLGAQFYLSTTYRKWGNTPNALNMTGAQIGRELQSRTDVSGVTFEGVPGQLTDHYDPSSHTVRMSESVATRPSVAAMAIVAHELGHAQQHQERSALIAMRSFLVPAMAISPNVAMFLIFFGLILQLGGLIWAGVLVFGIVVAFMLLTLPVEIDASARAMRLLDGAGLLQSQEDARGAQAVLTAAAMTYVAAAVQAVLQLLYFVSLARGRD